MLNAFYDLAVSPPTFDFIGFLVSAERRRVELGEDQLRIIIVPGPDQGFRADQLPPRDPKVRARMLKKIVLKLCTFLPSLAGVEECRDRFSAQQYKTGPVFPEGYDERNPAPHYGSKFIYDAVKAGCTPLSSGTPVKKNDRLITITLREAEYWPSRNSNLAEWQKVARHFMGVGFEVVFVRDTANATRALPGFATSADAAISLQARLELYEKARLNLFVNNGPSALAMLARDVIMLVTKLEAPNAPCASAEFFAVHGLPRGAQLSKSKVRILWSDDCADAVIAATEEFLKEHPASANGMRECA